MVAELFTLDFVLIMLGVGALAAAGAGALGANTVLQSIIFGVVSLLGLVTVRPMIRRRLQGDPEFDTPMGIEAIEGTEAIVVEPVSRDAGMIKIGGELWSARCRDATQIIEVGQRVRVVRIEGATAFVWKE